MHGHGRGQPNKEPEPWQLVFIVLAVIGWLLFAASHIL